MPGRIIKGPCHLDEILWAVAGCVNMAMETTICSTYYAPNHILR